MLKSILIMINIITICTSILITGMIIECSWTCDEIQKERNLLENEYENLSNLIFKAELLLNKLKQTERQMKNMQNECKSDDENESDDFIQYFFSF